jgi:hypothetical protein
MQDFFALPIITTKDGQDAGGIGRECIAFGNSLIVLQVFE